MKLKNSVRLSITLFSTVLAMAATANAQYETSDKGATQAPAVASSQSDSAQSDSSQSDSEQACFASGDPIVDNMPKRPTKKREQQIIDKLIRVVTHGYGSQQSAFSHLDHDHNCKLDKSEVSQLLKESKVNAFIRIIATGRLIDRYDVSDDGYVQWREFHFAIDKALEKQAKNTSPANVLSGKTESGH